MARIDDFKAQLVGGGARPTQFRVDLSYPKNLILPSAATAIQRGQFLIKATTLPRSTIEPTVAYYRGRAAKLPGDKVFDNWNFTVINDNDMVLRNFFEEWSNAIAGHASTNGVVKPIDYQTSMKVHQLDRNDNIIKTYVFHNCYPQVVSDIQLDFGATNTLEEFNVELSTDYWTTEAASGGSAATTDQ